ncbi:MAG: hypothetical protein ACXAE3_04215 [Candidatus Kariarchaeaceae archaeon]|jgi:hypothetical protein
MTRTSYALNADHLGYFFLMMAWIIVVFTAILYVSFFPSPLMIWATLIAIMFLPLLVITYKIFTRDESEREHKPEDKVLKYSKVSGR